MANTDNRKEYTVILGGVEHTLLLADEDLPRYPDAKASEGRVQNKARTTRTE